MKPQREHVTVPDGASWALLWRELPNLPFEWHYHPEFELTLTVNATGQRYIGDHLGDFVDGDLVLVGPNLPHTWSAQGALDETRPVLAVVVWFSREWVEQLVKGLPELAPIRKLAEQASRALSFSPAVINGVRPRLMALENLDTARRLPVLLDVLLELARDAQAQPLSSGMSLLDTTGSKHRLGKVLDVMHQRFAEPLMVEELAERVALSVGAFHRFFKRHTGKTVTAYLTQLRVGHACQLLIQSDKPIGMVAEAAGYRNLAHFNRQFMATKGITPRQFRQQYRAP
ncbi:helix-turn-helix domain-containing protein [Silvimonas amylolytica]|uniref:AraC family transcriptional regulator n=1 Tax=Silvimonas amylolytica TaxID=449663 RepID=A0ABQ2PLN7_9NEIS|nr:helix-turn-helix domain-containing protein [Silvimonas amylolytica]GGP26193.1 AraC family transcriptional regulator [Silvimonas amylolytica]